VALTVLVKKIFKYFAFTPPSFSLPVWKIFGISRPREQILKRTPQATFLQKISLLGVIVSEKKMLMPDSWMQEGL
jgi:hypothetical protein